jgi:hypothetical protein
MPNWDSYITFSKHDSPIDELAIFSLDGDRFAVTFDIAPFKDAITSLDEQLFHGGSRRSRYVQLPWRTDRCNYKVIDARASTVLAEETDDRLTDSTKNVAVIAKANDYIIIGTSLKEHYEHCMHEVIVIKQHLCQA